MEHNEIEVQIDKLEGEVGKVIRRVEELQKTVDLLYKDREILEDIQGSIKKMQEIYFQTRNHHDNAIQDVKADVKEAQKAVTEKVQEIGNQVDEKTVVIKSNSKGMLEKIKDLFIQRG